MLKQVMDALKDPNLSTIGLYGMGGVGKSTLAKEVHKKTVEDKLFDSVVMVHVSQTPELSRIQADIADFLGLNFDVDQIPARASRLHQRLKHSKTLIILDNIWAKLELNSIGIPLGDGCKLLLTSRSKDVLSSQMGTQIEFSLQVLPEKEAWSLFKRTATDTGLELPSIATAVARNCAGLPLLILRVAAALRNKKPRAWFDMFRQLSMIGNEEIHERVHKVVQSSYDNMPSKEIKSFFLLCALCGRSNIWINDLIRYSMGLDLFKDIFTIEGVRNRVFSVVDGLKVECLLMDGDMEGWVKMHDVVRDAALSIACKDETAFYGSSGARLKEWPNNDCTKISLPFCDINYLPQDLKYPKAEFFVMFTEAFRLQVSDLFFEGFKELKVVCLSGIHFMSLPSSLGFQTNLRTLCLEGCQLDSLANIGLLKQLVCLSFARSNIVELPKETEQLSELKVLDLSNCNNLKVIPSNVLAKLSLLEELYMGNSFVEWDVVGNASLLELEKLPHLTIIQIQDINYENIPSLPIGLQHYKIVIGDEQWNWGVNFQTSRMLKLKLKKGIHLVAGLKELLRGTETLYLGEVGGLENGLYDLDGEDCRQLRQLSIQNNSVIRYMIDSRTFVLDHVFPSLETLFLHNLNNLENICQGQLELGSFSKLQILKISECNKLRNLFSFSFAKCLVQLREMEVEDCANMEAIIAEGSKDDNDNDNNKVMEFTQLRSLRLNNLPCLGSIFSSKKVSLETQSQSKVALFSGMVSFPILTSLEVRYCKRLKYVFKASTVKSLLQLKTLVIENCEFVEEIIFPEKCEEESVKKMVFPNLVLLHLHALSNFIRFSNGFCIDFQLLREMKISSCPVLKNFVTSISNTGVMSSNNSGDIQSFFNEMVTCSNLLTMDISDMPNISCIWHNHQAFFINKLESLSISNCSSLSAVFSWNVFMRLHRLKNLKLSSLPSLKQIWNDDADGFFGVHILRSVEISDCDVLEYLFPAYVACDLLWLEKLQISKCGVEHIVGMGISDTDGYCFDFPHLTFLQLHDLKNLRSFYEGTHTSNWAKLKHLEVRGCHKSKILEHLRLEGKEIPNLETLILDGKSLKARYFPIERFFRLKVIELHELRDDDIEFLFGFIRMHSRLEKLVLTKESYLKELFLLDIVGKQVYAFVSLKCLELRLLPNLMHIWKEDNEKFPTKLHLEILKIESCDSLKSIAPSLVSFQHLTILHVDCCRDLEYLVTASTAQTMVHLMEMRITGCSMMREIVASDGDFAEHEIIFNQLKCLELKDLPELNSFCSGNYNFNFPLLEQLIVERCLQMKTFCAGVLSTPKLQGMKQKGEIANKLHIGKEIVMQPSRNASASTSQQKG